MNATLRFALFVEKSVTSSSKMFLSLLRGAPNAAGYGRCSQQQGTGWPEELGGSSGAAAPSRLQLQLPSYCCS